MHNFYFLIIFFILSSISFSNNFIQLKKNITSLLNTTKTIRYNNDIIVGSTGGFYLYDGENYLDLRSRLDSRDISCLKVNNNYLWVGNKGSGQLKIFDEEYNLHSNIQYPIFDEIIDIAFSDNYAFAIVVENNIYKIAQYNIEDINNPYYVNIFVSFPIIFESINDIEIINQTLYLATSEGLLTSNNNDDLVSLSTSWLTSFDFINISSIAKISDNIYLSYDNQIVDIDNNNIFSTLNNNSEIVVSYYNDSLWAIGTESLTSFDLNNSNILELVYPENIYDKVVSYSQIDNNIFLGIENRGLMIYNINTDNWSEFIPNSIYKNQFDALALTANNHLVGVVNHKNNNGQSGGFIYKNPNSVINDNQQILNFYSYNGYHLNNYPLSSSFYKAKILNYWSGDNSIQSAVINQKNELYIANSGIYPPSWLGYYETLANSNNFLLSNETKYGGVVEFNININNLDIEILDIWNLENNIIGGNSGIFNNNWTDGFMTINQILKDDNDNIWVVNPYSENNNNPIAIKSNNQWYHLSSEDNAYIPLEIAQGNNNNLWISYQFSETIDNTSLYSPGGIRMVEYKNINDNYDDIWHNSWLDELYGNNIWSIAMTNDGNNNQILWILSDYGVMGYIVNQNYTYSGNIQVEFNRIQEEYYFQELSFEQGDKLRVDNQENVWITTKSDGLRIIKNNGQSFDDNLGIINVQEYDILSNNIYDIIFDDYGYVYIATDKGISILETSFNKDLSSSNVSISPNPFIIGEDQQLIVSNISKKSIIKIINLSGYVVKEFDMQYYEKYIPWNGKSDSGSTLGTGIYLVSVYNGNKGTGVTKLAIINK